VACHADATGILAAAEGAAHEAVAAHERAIAAWTDEDEHRGARARSSRLRAYAIAQAGRPADAATIYRELRETASATLGPDHPDVAALELDLAAVLVELGDLAQARRRGAQASAVIESVYGRHSRRYARTLATRAALELNAGDFAAAIRLGTEAADLQRELELSALRRTEALRVLANAHVAIGDLEGALSVHVRLASELVGADDRLRAEAEHNVGELLCMLHRCAEARARFEWVAGHVRADTLAFAYAQNGLAKVELEAGAAGAAEIRLRHVLDALRIHGHDDPELQAEVRWNLARALANEASSASERVTLARAARAHYEIAPVREDIVAELRRIEAAASTLVK
jgi:hypothetical protein